MKYTKEQLAQMVENLETELKKSLELAKSESGQQVLAKSEDEAKDEKKEESKEEAKEESKEESKDEAKEEPKAESKEEPKEEAKEEAKEEDKGHEDDHGYDEQDLEELHKMYDSMKRGEHKAHLGALKKAMQKCWKGEDMDKCWKGEEAMENKDMDKCGEITVQKSENTKVETVEAKTETKPEESLLKSEIDTLKKENEDLKKSVDGLVSAMNSFFNKKQAPARKAITDVTVIKKNEGEESNKPLTKAEVDQILAKKVKDSKLSGSDRQAINDFYLNNAGLERIKHLLA